MGLLCPSASSVKGAMKSMCCSPHAVGAPRACCTLPNRTTASCTRGCTHTEICAYPSQRRPVRRVNHRPVVKNFDRKFQVVADDFGILRTANGCCRLPVATAMMNPLLSDNVFASPMRSLTQFSICLGLARRRCAVIEGRLFYVWATYTLMKAENYAQPRLMPEGVAVDVVRKCWDWFGSYLCSRTRPEPEQQIERDAGGDDESQALQLFEVRKQRCIGGGRPAGSRSTTTTQQAAGFPPFFPPFFTPVIS